MHCRIHSGWLLHMLGRDDCGGGREGVRSLRNVMCAAPKVQGRNSVGGTEQRTMSFSCRLTHSPFCSGNLLQSTSLKSGQCFRAIENSMRELAGFCPGDGKAS